MDFCVSKSGALRRGEESSKSLRGKLICLIEIFGGNSLSSFSESLLLLFEDSSDYSYSISYSFFEIFEDSFL